MNYVWVGPNPFGQDGKDALRQAELVTPQNEPCSHVLSLVFVSTRSESVRGKSQHAVVIITEIDFDQSIRGNLDQSLHSSTTSEGVLVGLAW